VDKLTLKTSGPAATRRLGERIGKLVEAGDVILLSGELGAGKTCLVQGVAKGLGVDSPVTSKTFVLLGEYYGRLRLYHADLYRIESPEGAEDLGLGEYTRNGVLMVEWAERAWDVLPSEHLLVRIDISGARSRQFEFEAKGVRYERLLDTLAKEQEVSTDVRPSTS
jgi:tRNA threonylcarbamoyladenosine biosynthesis protein TsaE